MVCWFLNRLVLRFIDECLFVIKTPLQTWFMRVSITGLLDSEGAQRIKSQRVDSSSMENSLRKALAS
jgi:hypothetical protein